MRTPLFQAEHSGRYKRQALIGEYQQITGANLIVVINAFEVTLPLPKEWLSIPYGNPLPGQAFRVMNTRDQNCPD